jgi:hypothetical protein
MTHLAIRNGPFEASFEVGRAVALPDDQVTSWHNSAMTSLRDEELWVAGCIQAALPGVIVGQHDDNTTANAYDLDLSVRGGRTYGAVEVTMAADAELVEFLKLVHARGGRWIAPQITGGWRVMVLPAARVKRLVTELPTLLGNLESAGVIEFSNRTSTPSGLATVAHDLGVVSARQADTRFPGSIYVLAELPMEQTSGWAAPTGDAVSTWISQWIGERSQADNLRKLQRSGAAERHLFVIVPGLESTAPFGVNDLLMRTGAPLPASPPVLPAEVTHVWIMGVWQSGQGFRWSPDNGWQTFRNDAALDQAALEACTC